MAEITLHNGDSRDVLRGLADASIDSIVTDPPYALVSIVKRFGGANAAPARDGDVYARASAGFMGKQWDTGETAFAVEFWAECLRVLKPGGHVVAFSGTRTYHRLAVAIEDAGFEIRDQLAWVYSTGFPKSHDVSKGIDKAAGHWRGRAGKVIERTVGQSAKGTEYERSEKGDPITAAAAAWQGWGTALKPAWEPIVLARKPLDGTVAANVLKHGTGAINIDGCRVGDKVTTTLRNGNSGGVKFGIDSRVGKWENPPGRFPANIIHDGSDEVIAAFPNDGDISAARFFYSAKADKLDRWGSKHPTVKPVDLMRWLCRLVTPPGGVVLDPFSGSGSTGVAAFAEGFDSVLIEREAEYAADIRARIDHVKGLAPHSFSRLRSVKNNGSAGPLFASEGER